MKTALAFICSLMLAWTTLVTTQAAASVTSTAASCHCGKKTGCCAANRSKPESPPVSATSAPSFQNQFSLIAPATVAWALPGTTACELSSSLISSSSMTSGIPLFARNCAWLI
jgi:hypothetical protein